MKTLTTRVLAFDGKIITQTVFKPSAPANVARPRPVAVPSKKK